MFSRFMIIWVISEGYLSRGIVDVRNDWVIVVRIESVVGRLSDSRSEVLRRAARRPRGLLPRAEEVAALFRRETLLCHPCKEVKLFPGKIYSSLTHGVQFIMYVLRRSLCRRQPCSPCTVCLEFKPDRLSSDIRYDGARSWYQNFCVLFDSWIVCLIFKTRKQSWHALRPVPPKLRLAM